MTIIAWSLARYLLYSSYFAMCGVVFGYANFGRIVGFQSVIAGVIGLLQIPFTKLVLGPLDSDFLPMQIASATWVSTLFVVAWYIYKWEHSDRLHDKPSQHSKQIPAGVAIEDV